MRAPTAPVLPAALALALAVPAPPAQAAPGCGGAYTFTASCRFQVPTLSLVVVQGTAYSAGVEARRPKVTVAAYDGATIEASCSASGFGVATCTGNAFVAAGGWHTCRVGGIEGGTYSCVAVPLTVSIDS